MSNTERYFDLWFHVARKLSWNLLEYFLSQDSLRLMNLLSCQLSMRRKELPHLHKLKRIHIVSLTPVSSLWWWTRRRKEEEALAPLSRFFSSPRLVFPFPFSKRWQNKTSGMGTEWLSSTHMISSFPYLTWTMSLLANFPLALSMMLSESSTWKVEGSSLISSAALTFISSKES